MSTFSYDGMLGRFLVKDKEEIAMLFEQRARIADAKVKAARLVKHRALYTMEANTWYTAASILRNTIIDPSIHDKETT